MQELDSTAEFDAARDVEFFSTLPARPAVFAVESRADLIGAKPYLLRTANLRQRLARLLGPPDPASKRLNLRDFAARVRYRVVGSPFELSFLHWQHARRLWPAGYRERVRLRPPAMLKVSLSNAYPRCYATRRIGANGFYFGPFASRRAADTFASGFLDLFKIRRCQIKIRRDPSFPGCIYSEMKMCLAPCFAGCSKEDYDAEVGRVVAFLATGGASLTAELEREREAASEALDFERAAAVHRRIEKAGGSAARIARSRAASRRPQRRRSPASGGRKHGGRIRGARRAHRGAAPAALRGTCQRAPLGRTNPARVAGRRGRSSFTSRKGSRFATKLSRTRRSTQLAGALVPQEAARRGNFLSRKHGALFRRRAAGRGQRAPQQRVAVSPHFARLLAAAGAAGKRKLTVQQLRQFGRPVR